MALTDTAVKNAKPDPARPSGYKKADGDGLFLLVKPSGKYWRMDYRFADKRNTLALGGYPAVSLKEARKRRDDARALLAKDLDPSAQKRIDKATVKTAAANTFEAIARELHAIKAPSWSPLYALRHDGAVGGLPRPIAPRCRGRALHEESCLSIYRGLRARPFLRILNCSKSKSTGGS